MATDIRLSVGDGDVTDDINLDDGTGYVFREMTFSAPPGSPFRTVSWVEDIKGSSSDDVWAKFRALNTKIEQANQAKGPYGHGTRVTLSMKFNTATSYVYFDVVGGYLNIDPSTFNAAIIGMDWIQTVVVTLICLPYARGDAVTTTVSGTITATAGTYSTPGGGAGSGGLFIADVPGDVPALARHTITDTSGGSQYINRMRINAFSMRDPAGVYAQSAFTPWIAAVASGAGVSVADATAVGGASCEINLSSSLQRVAQFAKPAGALNTGLFDVFARVKDSTVLLGPPTLTALAVKNDVNIGERQSASYTSTSSASATPAWSNPTLTGSTLLMGVMIQSNAAITTPSGWTAGSTVTHASNDAKVALFYINAAASRSGTETVTIGSAVRCSVFMLELIGAAASAVDVQVTGTASAASLVLTSGALAQATEMVYGFFAHTTTSAHTFSSAFNDATELFDSNRSHVGRARASATTTHTITSGGSSTDIAGVLIAIKQAQSVAVNIPAGTYEVGVVAASASDTYLSELSNTSTVTVAQTDAVIMPEWTAGTGAASVDHYRMYYRLVGGAWEYYNMPAAANYLSYTIVTDAGTVANPPTTGPEATLVYFLAALSDGTQTYFTKAAPTTLGGSLWEWLYMGVVPLPPQVAGDGLSPRDWIGFIEAKNTTAAGAFDVDSIVILPHPSPTANNSFTFIAEYKNLALGTLRRWNMETNRYGGNSAYLSVVGGDTNAGQLTVKGESLIAPGDSWLTLVPDVAAGVSDVVNVTYTHTVTYTPRYIWLRGGV